MRFVYQLEPNGEATGVRSEPVEYVLQPGELEMEAPAMPERETLHGIEFRRLLEGVRVDSAAEAARLRYITPGAGQALTYQRKDEQAYRYREAGYPSAQLADYPMVKAEKEALGVTGTVAADGILAKAAEWEALAAAIDKERRGAKLAIEAATDATAIEAARDAALAALEVI